MEAQALGSLLYRTRFASRYRSTTHQSGNVGDRVSRSAGVVGCLDSLLGTLGARLELGQHHAGLSPELFRLFSTFEFLGSSNKRGFSLDSSSACLPGCGSISPPPFRRTPAMHATVCICTTGYRLWTVAFCSCFSKPASIH